MWISEFSVLLLLSRLPLFLLVLKSVGHMIDQDGFVAVILSQ